MELGAALVADAAALERHDIFGATAESAGALHFADRDAGAFDRDQELVALADVEQTTGFGRDDDSSQVVDLANDSGFHPHGLLCVLVTDITFYDPSL